MSRNLETIAHNESQNEECRVVCADCIGETRHKILQSIDIKGAAYDWDYHYQNSYQIVQCQGCDSLSFRKVHTNSEDYFVDPDTNEYFENAKIDIYPNRVAGRAKLKHIHFLPNNVGQIYHETHLALCSKQPILAVIGIRALVETVCNEKNATGRNLEERIDNLVALGILTNQNAELLHSLRILGNEAAHEVKVQDEQTLSLAMDVVEQLLNNVYILPAITAKLPKRKTSIP
ncbi:MAG: DUF4145 domain-containing protein [Acidobacteriota bacterium]|nr:DUF4145 domain-containing protein [Acidobacteriota bacterium]